MHFFTDLETLEDCFMARGRVPFPRISGHAQGFKILPQGLESGGASLRDLLMR